jgi:predicted NUDIX family NTP pyrophosphohydrolase
MPKQSAGILLYKIVDQQVLVFLVHPGGPFWKNKDTGVWSVPKGEFEPGEDILDAARREFEEETGQLIHGEFTPLEPVTQRSGKKVFAWAVEGDIDTNNIVSNRFDLEFPPRSGKYINIPEVDRGDWFSPKVAVEKINPGQVGLIEQLVGMLAEK